MESVRNEEGRDSKSGVSIARRMKALSHPYRLGILRLLAQEPMTNKQLATSLGAPAGQLHFHTKTLLAAHLIEIGRTEKVGTSTQIYYRCTEQELRVPLREDGLAPRLLHFLLGAAELYQETWTQQGGGDFPQRGFHQVYYQSPEKQAYYYQKVVELMNEFRDSTVDPSSPGAKLMTLTMLSHEIPM